jgi:hypothetical protein
MRLFGLAPDTKTRKEFCEMKNYQVKITETLSMTVTVEAENAMEARDIAERNWKNSEYILDADHFQGVTFTLPKNRDRKR